MNPRIAHWSEYRIFNIIQRIRLVTQFDALHIPRFTTVQFGDTTEGVIVNNGFQRCSVIGINPISELIVFTPTINRCILRKRFEISLESRFIGFEVFIIHFTCGGNVLFQECIKRFVTRLSKTQSI